MLVARGGFILIHSVFLILSPCLFPFISTYSPRPSVHPFHPRCSLFSYYAIFQRFFFSPPPFPAPPAPNTLSRLVSLFPSINNLPSTVYVLLLHSPQPSFRTLNLLPPLYHVIILPPHAPAHIFNVSFQCPLTLPVPLYSNTFHVPPKGLMYKLFPYIHIL